MTTWGLSQECKIVLTFQNQRCVSRGQRRKILNSPPLLIDENTECLSIILRTRQGYIISPLILNIILELLANAIRQDKFYLILLTLTTYINDPSTELLVPHTSHIVHYEEDSECYESHGTVCNHNRKAWECHHPKSKGSFRLGWVNTTCSMAFTPMGHAMCSEAHLHSQQGGSCLDSLDMTFRRSFGFASPAQNGSHFLKSATPHPNLIDYDQSRKRYRHSILE